MRPKRHLLLVSADPDWLALRAFLFVTRGYRVTHVRSLAELVDDLALHSPDCVVVDYDTDGCASAAYVKCVTPDVPVVLFAPDLKPGSIAHRADALLSKGACAPVDLLERVRVCCSRKRGPRKAVQGFTSASAEAMQSRDAERLVDVA